MKREQLNRLRCPRCKSEFDSSVDHDHIEFALLTCECSTYPLVEGIAVLRADALTQLAVKMLQSKAYSAATALLLNRQSFLPARQLLGELATKVRSLPPFVPKYLSMSSTVDCYRRSVGDHENFSSVVQQFESEYLTKYLCYRPFEQSFWNLHAFLPLICEQEAPILDFGGGWGHSSYLLNRITDRTVYNIEIDFRPLYVQNQFLSKDIGGVVIEPGMDIPFNEETFGTLLDLDGFHYVENKYGTASEYERTVRDDGKILLLHTHDRRVTRRGVPLSPSSYQDCFSWNTTVVGESDLLSGFLDGRVDITGLPDPAGREQDLDIIVSRDPIGEQVLETANHPLKKYGGVFRVNPVYEVEERADHWILQRTPLGDKFRSEFVFSINNTKSEYQFSKNESPPAGLRYRGIVIPFPETYAPGPSL